MVGMSESAYPGTVCWRITSNCNRKCPFCYRPNTTDLKNQQIKKIIDSLHSMNVKCLGITGGEPLTMNNIDQILEYVKDKGFKICLGTNTDFFEKYREYIFRCVDAIGIPLESTEYKIHDSLRGKDSLKNIKATLEDILENSNLRVFITTVLTNKNYKEMEKIERFLFSFKDRLIFWKIYELIDYSGRKNQKITNIKTDVVGKGLKNLGNFLGKNKVFYRPALERSRVYFLLNSDGDVIVPREKDGKFEDLIIGNMLSDHHEKILSRWREETNIKEYRRHLCALKFI
jgi:MoaA/NifB/PqqE/SkfB family radical SAM enzyme